MSRVLSIKPNKILSKIRQRLMHWLRFRRADYNNMSDEFKEDIGKTAQFFMKTGRTYTGEIKSISKNNFLKLKDKFDKPVKLAENDISSVEYGKGVKNGD